LRNRKYWPDPNPETSWDTDSDTENYCEKWKSPEQTLERGKTFLEKFRVEVLVFGAVSRSKYEKIGDLNAKKNLLIHNTTSTVNFTSHGALDGYNLAALH
jgi:hypothetical protein